MKKRPAPSAAVAVRRDREATMRHIGMLVRSRPRGAGEADLAELAALTGLWEWIRGRMSAKGRA